jgi:hypothetical protein
MCVLCWQFLTESHWTDRRFEDNDSTIATAGSDHERARRRDRHHRTQVLNQILTHYGLRLDDWHSRSYLLSDRKGKTAIVQDLGAPSSLPVSRPRRVAPAHACRGSSCCAALR